MEATIQENGSYTLADVVTGFWVFFQDHFSSRIDGKLEDIDITTRNFLDMLKRIDVRMKIDEQDSNQEIGQVPNQSRGGQLEG